MEPKIEPQQFRKKPIVVEAVQYLDWMREKDCLPQGVVIVPWFSVGDAACVHTLEGDMRVSEGDWIIKGVKGEFYPCKPDIFAATYELAAHAPISPAAPQQLQPFAEWFAKNGDFPRSTTMTIPEVIRFAEAYACDQIKLAGSQAAPTPHQLRVEIDAIMRVAKGQLDRGSPEERLQYIAEVCRIILSGEAAPTPQPDVDKMATLLAKIANACNQQKSIIFGSGMVEDLNDIPLYISHMQKAYADLVRRANSVAASPSSESPASPTKESDELR